MTTLEKAISLASQYHAGQVDKGGNPYILHPLRVMLNVNTMTEKIVAVLHDIIEDTEMTADELRNHGFSDAIIQAVLALTKLPNETRVDAAYRAAKNPIARVVKLADVSDNMDISRLKEIGEKDRIRLAEYAQVKSILEQYPCNTI